MKKHILSFCIYGLVFIFALCIGSASFAKEKVAAINGVKGKVEVKSGGGAWTPASDGTTLYEGDSVRTKIGAECQIVFNAGHNIKVSAMSNISVKAPRKATKKDKDKNPKSDVKVTFGKIYAKVKKSTGGNITKFEVSTPTAIAGVRGTMLSQDVESAAGPVEGDTPPEEAPADPVCTTSVAEGSVEVTNEEGEEIIVNEGQEVTADISGDLPEEAAPMSEENKGDWEANKTWVEQVQLEVEGAVPGTPGTPATPATPGTPGTPATPATPATPGTPTETGKTETPTTPATTETTTAPSTTETTTTPATTETATPAETTETPAETATETPAETATEEGAAGEEATAEDASDEFTDASDEAAEEPVDVFSDNTDLQDNLSQLNDFGIILTPEQEDVAALLESGELNDLLAAGVDITQIEDAALAETLNALAESGALDSLLEAGVDLTQIDSAEDLLNAATEAGLDTSVITDISSGAADAEAEVSADTTQDAIGTQEETFDVPEIPEDALSGTEDVSVDEEVFTQ